MRIHFLSRNQTPLSPADPLLLHEVKAEILRRPGFLEVFRPEDAEAIILEEITSFKEWRYIEQLRVDPVVGRFPHKTYTINTDDGAAGLLRGIYTCLSRQRFDPQRHRAVPYASSPIEAFYPLWRNGWITPPAFLASWRGNLKSSQLRGRLHRALAHDPKFRIESTESWFDHSNDEKEHYVDVLLSSKFSLCPAGWAGVTFRIYESMALGITPVIIADSFVAPQGPDWASFSLSIPEKKIGDVEAILAANESSYAEMGIQARRAWERHFSPTSVFGFYADALIECVRCGAAASRGAELKRWSSLRMRWNNRWTLPQRLQARFGKLVSRKTLG